MKIEELFKQYNYTPPYGEMEFPSNVEQIFKDLLVKVPVDTEIEVNRKQLATIFQACKDEILFSFLLDDKKLFFKEMFRKGLEFRGFVLKVY